MTKRASRSMRCSIQSAVCLRPRALHGSWMPVQAGTGGWPSVLLEDEDNEVMGGALRYMYQSSVGEGYDQLAPLDLVIVRKTCWLDTLCLIYAWRSFRGTTGVRSRRTRGSPGPRNMTNNDEYGCTVLQSINRPDSGLICYICSHGRPCRQRADAPFSRSLLRFAPYGRDPSTL